jgi:CBS domain-containing protein
MTGRVREIMTPNPIALDAEASAVEAANMMKKHNVGDVLVSRAGELYGLVTDRDLVVRCLAEEGDARTSRLGELCSGPLATISPDAPIADAMEVMKQHAVRRLPVVENGDAVGIVSLGDIARVAAPEGVLGQISSAPPNS